MRCISKYPGEFRLFGIAAEALPLQTNYLFDEHECIGKDASKCHGPNSVLSMLHDHLQSHCLRVPSLGLHCDNCCGQDKNRTVVAYLSWRTIVGLNTDINLCFMRVGHTRCFVDGGFGFIKQRYRKSDVDTVAQLATVVDESVTFNKAKLFSWNWHEWDAYLAKFFNPVKNITKISEVSFLGFYPWEGPIV